jgi:hypothetical protein
MDTFPVIAGSSNLQGPGLANYTCYFSLKSVMKRTCIYSCNFSTTSALLNIDHLATTAKKLSSHRSLSIGSSAHSPVLHAHKGKNLGPALRVSGVTCNMYFSIGLMYLLLETLPNIVYQFIIALFTLPLRTK